MKPVSDSVSNGECRRAGTDGRRGLTLVEVVVSAAATAILLAGMASAILLTTHALPEDSHKFDVIVDSGDVLEQVSSELLCAASIIDHNATSITFTVADRDGDDVPETICYEWSGTPGDSVTRQYNGGNDVAVLEDVFALWLDYETVTISQTGGPTPEESDELLLASFTGTDDLTGREVKHDRWLGEYFQPTLVAEAVSWRVTRVRLRVRRAGDATGQCLVQLRPANADYSPTDEVLAQLPLSESDLSESYEWRDFSFPAAPQSAPENGLCIVIEHVANSPSCKVRYQDDNVEEPNMRRLRSTDGGSSWSVDSDKALLFYAHGTVTTLGTEQIPLFSQLVTVRITISVGDNGDDHVETLVHLLNMPEITE